MPSVFEVKSVLVRGVSNSMAAEALRADVSAPEVNMENAKAQHEKYVNIFK